MVTIEDVRKVEVKIGKVVNASKVENSDKLIKLEVDFGSGKRQIITAMADYFKPEHFVGKEMPFFTNLEPRKMRGLVSEGMIMAADVEGKPVLLHPEKNVPPGSNVI